jgi:hypothetical protein
MVGLDGWLVGTWDGGNDGGHVVRFSGTGEVVSLGLSQLGLRLSAMT